MATSILKICLPLLIILQVCPVEVLGWSRVQAWDFTNAEECKRYYANITMQEGYWCPPMWDGVLCWPPSPYNAVALLPCPPNSNHYRIRTASQRCTEEGEWEIVKRPPSGFHVGPSHQMTHPCFQFKKPTTTATTPTPPPPTRPDQGLPWSGGAITDFRVSSKIEQRYAQTTVSVTMRNTKDRPDELKFRMTIPKNAFISSLIMEIDGDNYTSIVRQKSDATRTYKIAREKGKTSGLVRQSGVQEFEVRASVVSHEVTFFLKYEELLRRVNGQYIQKIYVRPGYRIPEAEVTVHIHEREPIKDYRILELPGQELSGNSGAKVSEELLEDNEIKVNYKHLDPPNGRGKGVDGTFVIAYNLRNHFNGGEIQRKGRYFAHFLSLDANEQLPKMATHTVFALDVSNSMGDGKLNQMKNAMRSILKSMTPSDSFEILAFSSDVASLGVFNGTHMHKALRRLRKLQPIGYSNLNAAYLQALRSAEATPHSHISAKQIVMITDGEITKGVRDLATIRRNVFDANRHGYPIYGLGFGTSFDFNLIQQISADSQAFSRLLDSRTSLSRGIQEFYKEISKPILTNLVITYPENEVDPTSVVKIANSNFYSGGEVVAAGHIRHGVHRIHPWVTGEGKIGPMHLQIDPEKPYGLPPVDESEQENSVVRLWAYLRLRHLLSQAELNNDKSLRDQATQLALRFGFVTHVTSLVVIDSTGEHEASIPETGFFQHPPRYGPHGFQSDAPQPPRWQSYEPVTQGFVDQDPYFVVYSPGMNLPFCFDFHTQNGAFLSLIRDVETGIIVNGETKSSVTRPRLTYISKLFLALGQVNITITPEYLEVDCIGDDGKLKVDHVTRSLWPFYKKNGKKYKKRMAVRPTPRAPVQESVPLDQKNEVERQSESEDHLRTHEYHTYPSTGHPSSQTTENHYDTSGYPSGSLADVDQNPVPYIMNSIEDDYLPHRKRFVNQRMRYHRAHGRQPRGDHVNRGQGRRSRAPSDDQSLCNFSSTWEAGVGKKYGNVMIILNKKKNLHITIGDGEAHFAVVRSQKNGQWFLGFYLENQNVMSKSAHGIIGQFTAKNITVSDSTPISPPSSDSTVQLQVKRRNKRKRYRTSQVSGFLSNRRSILSKENVECIQVRRQGKGLIDGKPEDYLLNCLQC